MADVEKIKRSLFAAFMNTTPGEETATWARMGKGITSLTVSYNPNVTTEQYIDEDNGYNSVDSYAPSIDGSHTCYKGEPVFEYLDGLRKRRALGADVETDILLVYLYDATGADSGKTYSAEKNKACIQFGDFGGDAGGQILLNYTIGMNGDPEIGTVTIADGKPTFTKSE